MDHRIISLGALSMHPLWGEKSPVRTGHATTTLIRSGDRTILVDPGLPDAAVAARLAERARLTPADVTHVFLTSFQPDTFRGIDAFDRATWWVSEPEREAIGAGLVGEARSALEQGNQTLARALERDIGVLRRCEPAPDEIAPGVKLFPLPGVTPGLTGLILAEALRTTLIVGDAIPTIEHLEQGRIVPWASDVEIARESFAEAIEIADLLVLGRDNWAPSPGAGQRPGPRG